MESQPLDLFAAPRRLRSPRAAIVLLPFTLTLTFLFFALVHALRALGAILRFGRMGVGNLFSFTLSFAFLWALFTVPLYYIGGAVWPWLGREFGNGEGVFALQNFVRGVSFRVLPALDFVFHPLFDVALTPRLQRLGLPIPDDWVRTNYLEWVRAASSVTRSYYNRKVIDGISVTLESTLSYEAWLASGPGTFLAYWVLLSPPAFVCAWLRRARGARARRRF